MARDYLDGDGRYQYDSHPSNDRDRKHRRRHRHHDDDDDDSAARRDRRERRRADEARRQAELDIEELRARRESYYSRPEQERRREPQRMAQEIQIERDRNRVGASPRALRRDGTVRSKRTRERTSDDRSDEYVYGRPSSRAAVEEATVRRSTGRHRSDEGGSSSRTAYTPMSGSRSTSVRKSDVPTVSRTLSAREPQKVYMTRPSIRRTSTVRVPADTASPIVRTQSMRESARRSTRGLFAGLLKPPPRPPTILLQKEVPRVECLVCMNEDVPASKTAKLGCGHRMCHSCLRRQFTLSVSDPQHMPPRCCTSDHIPLKHVDRLFDDKFKKLWNKKYQEYTTANRLYCPTKGCGEWIKPSKIRMDLTYGRKYARCGRCSTKVCVLCNGRFHTRRDCPRDEETNKLVQMAKEKGWQRCYSCKAVVELKEGCNHMTCRCTAQFCMVCAAPWKTCNCPWFNYTQTHEDDRLNDMQVPHAGQDYVEVIELPPEPPLARRSSTRSRYRPDRGGLEHADAALAAHLRAQMRLDATPTASEVHRADPRTQVYGLGNSGGHHMNESYAVRPLANSATRTAARASPPRASIFSRRSVRESTPRTTTARSVRASTMAGLSRDGTKRGANRVGTWLTHIEVDAEAIRTAPKDVEVDDWRLEGSIIGID